MKATAKSPLAASWVGTRAWTMHRLRALSGREGRCIAASVLAVTVALSFVRDLPLLNGLHLALFDEYQIVWPRLRQSAPAVIVEIDEASLRVRGQWPWPRTLLAELLRGISRSRPAAIGIDILFPEADRSSPESILARLPDTESTLRRRVAGLPSNDSVFAAALAQGPVVLGFAGTQEEQIGTRNAGSSPPFLTRGDGTLDLPVYTSAVRSLVRLQRAAQTQGLITTELSDGRVRRIPVIAKVENQVVPSLSMEMLRIASGDPGYVVETRGGHMLAMKVGTITVPMTPEGQSWIYFTPHNQDRFVSAEDILSGRADASLLTDKFVLVGLTALGLVDQQLSAIGERMPGVEIHAQFLENVFDDELLRRPQWFATLERAILVALGALLIVLVPQLRPVGAGAFYLTAACLLLALGAALFRWKLLLFDTATPLLGATAVFVALIAGKLAAVDRQRRFLEREQARAAGEMGAARRIQMGLLPDLTGEFHTDRRFSISAVMEPAREVGGDFFDFFKPSEDHLIAMVGDVSGKGLPASMFMAITKVLMQNAALRGSSKLEQLMGMAQSEVARNNPESLFVTVLAVMLDLRTGVLQVCSAGHDAPFSVSLQHTHPVRLDAAGGPPLCVIDDFKYTSARHQMSRGEVLCLVTDGVTEANNSAQAMYGAARLVEQLESTGPVVDMAQLVQSILGDVRQFEFGVERSDDLTILALRWNGADQLLQRRP